MGDAHDERTWRAPSRRRRARTLALAATLHVALLAALLHRQGRFERPRAATVVETTIWAGKPPRVTRAPAPQPVHATRAPRKPRTAADKPIPTTPAPTAVAPSAETPITLAPLAAAPASAASAPPSPLRLELSRDQIRQLEASTPLTLAQQVPHEAPLSPLQQLGPDDGYSEKQLPGGITEVHVHGGCFRLVPSLQSQLDPFNPHPRLTGPCLKNF